MLQLKEERLRTADRLAPILIVAPDKDERAHVRNAVAMCGDVLEAATDADAVTAASGLRCQAFIVCVSNPTEGCTLRGLTQLRRTHRSTPALLLLERVERAVLARAFKLDAQCLCKPVSPALLNAFAKRTQVSREAPSGASITHKLSLVAAGARLTPSERDLLAAAVHGLSGKEYAVTQGISINTYKTHVRHLLRKVGALSVGEVRDTILRSR